MIDRRPVSKKGSITILFIGFALVLIGVMSLSFVVGGRVSQTLHAQIATDASAQAMGAHAAQGLNMIAINNQGIAAGLHLNHSLLLVAYYMMAGRAFLYGASDLFKDLVLTASKRDLFANQIQKDVLTPFEKLGQYFIGASAGLTLYNKVLRDHWLSMAPGKAIEFARLNEPGALVFPFQNVAPHQLGAPFQIMKFNIIPPNAGNNSRNWPIRTSSPQDAICLTTGTRENENGFLKYLQGPLETIWMLAGTAPPGNDVLSGLTAALDKLYKYMPVKFGLIRCGIALTSPLFNFFRKEFLNEATGSPLATAALLNATAMSQMIKDIPTAVGKKLPTEGLCAGMSAASAIQIGIELGKVLVTDNSKLQDAAYQSMLLKNMYEKGGGPTTIPYSEIAATNCVRRDPGPGETEPQYTDPQCNRGLTVKQHTYLCPYREQILSGMVEGECTYGSDWELKKKNPKKIIENWLKENSCDDFDKWREHQDIANNGFMLVDLGCQADSYTKLASRDGSFLMTSGGVGPKRVCAKPLQVRAPVASKDGRESTLGFLYPNSKLYERLKAQLNFTALVAKPIWTASEATFMTEGNNCQDFLLTALDDNQVQRCRVELFALLGNYMRRPKEDENKPLSPDLQVASGGQSGLGNDKIIWGRMNWTLAKARVEYMEGSKDPTPKDPRMTFFWPAWTVVPGRAKMQEIFSNKTVLLGALLDQLTGAYVENEIPSSRQSRKKPEGRVP